MIFYFYIGVALAGIFLFLLAQSIHKKFWALSKFFSGLLLTLSFLIFGTGLLELFLNIIEATGKNISGPPPTPKIFSTNAAAHIHIPNTILYLQAPNQEFRTFGHRYKTNSLGFREREFSHKKPKNTFRVLVFGSSLTFGQALDKDHRFTNILEQMFRRKSPNLSIEVLNFGMPGYSLDQVYQLAKVILKNIECDFIVVEIPAWLQMTTQKYLTEITNLGEYRKREIINLSFSPIFNNLTLTLKDIPFEEPESFGTKTRWFNETQIFRYLDKVTNINIDKLIPTSARWGYALNQLTGILNLCSKYKLPPPITLLMYRGLINPGNNDFINPTGHLAQNIKLLKFIGQELSHQNFTVTDPLNLFQKYSGMVMAVSEWDLHPNYLANYIYAQSLFNVLTKQLPANYK